MTVKELYLSFKNVPVETAIIFLNLSLFLSSTLELFISMVLIVLILAIFSNVCRSRKTTLDLKIFHMVMSVLGQVTLICLNCSTAVVKASRSGFTSSSTLSKWSIRATLPGNPLYLYKLASFLFNRETKVLNYKRIN